MAECYEHAIEIVNQVAEEYVPDINVGSKDGWIPCSERLPDESGKYTVCTAKGSVYCAKFTVGKKDKFFHADMYTHIIAWQPLPAPYKPKGE